MGRRVILGLVAAGVATGVAASWLSRDPGPDPALRAQWNQLLLELPEPDEDSRDEHAQLLVKALTSIRLSNNAGNDLEWFRTVEPPDNDAVEGAHSYVTWYGRRGGLGNRQCRTIENSVYLGTLATILLALSERETDDRVVAALLYGAGALHRTANSPGEIMTAQVMISALLDHAAATCEVPRSAWFETPLRRDDVFLGLVRAAQCGFDAMADEAEKNDAGFMARRDLSRLRRHDMALLLAQLDGRTDFGRLASDVQDALDRMDPDIRTVSFAKGYRLVAEQSHRFFETYERAKSSAKRGLPMDPRAPRCLQPE